ncbi:MAG: hypothetical protein LUG85_00875 [Clostridiales bacterium]|nr:hypothetical protein [Clostridiales bacterium]
MTENTGLWTGTATELCKAINADMKPNTLTQKLNVNAGGCMTNTVLSMRILVPMRDGKYR